MACHGAGPRGLEESECTDIVFTHVECRPQSVSMGPLRGAWSSHLTVRFWSILVIGWLSLAASLPSSVLPGRLQRMHSLKLV